MNWDYVKLEDVSTIIAGQSPKSKYYNQLGQGIPFFQGKADFGLENPNVRYWCTEPTKIAQPLDILLSVRAPVGPTNICDVESCIGRGLAAIRVRESLNYKYLYWWFKSFEKQLSLMGNGSTFSAITSKVVKDLKIPLPPLHIQEKIVDILDKADALRRKDQELLTKYDELAHAVFYKMFGDPIKNEMGWSKTVLKSVTSKIGSGSTPTGGKVAYKSSGISLIRSMNIYDFAFKWKDLAYIDDTQASKLSNVEVKSKDVLFNITGASVCRCSIVPDEVLPARINQHVAILRAKQETLNPVFLNHLLVSNSVKSNLLKVGSSGGAVMEAITKEKLESFEIILPPIEIQNKFEETIDLVFNGKKKITETINKSNHLFESLIQKAFVVNLLHNE